GRMLSPMDVLVLVLDADGVNLVPTGDVLRIYIELYASRLEIDFALELGNARDASDSRRGPAFEDFNLVAVDLEDVDTVDRAWVEGFVDGNPCRHDRLVVFQKKPFVIVVLGFRRPGISIVGAEIDDVGLSRRLFGSPGAWIALGARAFFPDIPVGGHVDP